MTDDVAAAIDDIEVAFGRLVPILKARMAAAAEAFHPDLRAAGWGVLRLVLITARRSPDVPLTVSDIVAETQMDKSVVSRQLRDLKDWGLVTVERSEGDARVYLVRPTDEASRRYEQRTLARRQEYRELFSEWDPDDVASLARLMLKFTEHSEALVNRP